MGARIHWALRITSCFRQQMLDRHRALNQKNRHHGLRSLYDSPCQGGQLGRAQRATVGSSREMSQRAGTPTTTAPRALWKDIHSTSSQISQAQLLLDVKHSLGQRHRQPKAHEAQHPPSSEVKLTGEACATCPPTHSAQTWPTSPLKQLQQLWLVPQTLQVKGVSDASTLTVTPLPGTWSKCRS